MRTNNAKVKNVIISVYFILIVLAILLATVFSAFTEVSDNPFMTFTIVATGFVVLFFIVYYISKYFEYDSDGVKVVVINRGLLLADYFNYRENKVEFTKDQLVRYRINNFIVYKSLVLYIKDKRGHVNKDRFNITLVSRRKRKYIKQSLSKMIKLNRKSK
ncbi:hypothetical protein [Mangrovimonas sp. YM274]|uniref:hypothetical protein n=1 Tax=Mangrovimonas sp. YM274 TaxID=3070660 RepID=UPI0027DE0BDD|nr:hypothetical protein [Mangrovimonas sp. YM274]WMI67247.1 hypothetical protein RBH95_08820 [Mangrovimonas sp. YM274]